MIILEGLTWLAACVWVGAAVRAIRTRSANQSHLGEESPQTPSGNRVALIVPARNEEGVIEQCIKSVVQQEIPGLNVWVLDDGSDDQTGVILARLASQHENLTIVNGGDEALPEGWLGKPWACQRAAKAAIQQRPDLEWLLFVDADVQLQPQAVGAAVQEATAHDVDLLSGLGNLELKSFWERVFQPVVAGLILAGNDLSKINEHQWKPEESPLANGHFIISAECGGLARRASGRSKGCTG